MPTILTHPAVPIALAVGLGNKVVPPRLLAAGIVASILPDLDVIAFRFGIAYADEFGHRGFSHSLFGAALVGLLGACLYRWYGTGFKRAWAFLFIAMASHGVLDAFTTGGKGIAFFWPLSDTRFFAPWQVIEVSSLSLSRFFSHRGVEILRSEFHWVWLPLMSVALLMLATRHLSDWLGSAGRTRRT